MTQFSIEPRGPFSLAASAAFLAGFTPASSGIAHADQELRLAFATDGGGAAGVRLSQGGDTISGEIVTGENPEDIVAQLARVLSLDHDGRAYPAVGERDPVIGNLMARYPGLRPVLFFSPYEAAAWAIIGNQISMVQAAGVKARMADALGTAVEIAGESMQTFPTADRLADLEQFPGLTERKIGWLRGLARATDQLDPVALRAVQPAEALARLREIPGIGPFGAELVLVRGAGASDHLPTNEPRIVQAVARAYRLNEPPSPREFARIAEPWRPYRSWVCVLLRTWFGDERIADGDRP